LSQKQAVKTGRPQVPFVERQAKVTRAVNRIDNFGIGEIRRLINTGRAMTRAGVFEGARYASRIPRQPLRPEPLPRAAATALRRGCEELGPAYVKFAQIIASSPGLFPDVLSDEFRKCLDAVPPMPRREVHQRIRRELGAPVKDIFEYFDDTPLASASIAQVHRARYDGNDIVVKVRRPGLVRRFRHDLRILRRIAGILNEFETTAVANPIGVVEDFARTLYEEMDFAREGESMERFEANISKGDYPSVNIPKVHWDYTSERVLTMSREYGVAPDDADTILNTWNIDVMPVFLEAAGAWIESAFVHGFFHGDLHAGNLMLNENGIITFLDFGIMGNLEEDDRKVLRKLIPAIMVQGDFDLVAEMITDLAAFSSSQVTKEQATNQLADDIRKLHSETVTKTVKELAQSFGSILSDVITAARTHGLFMPKEFVLIGKQMLYLERYAQVLLPDYEIFTDPKIMETLMTSLDLSDNEVH